MGILDEGGREIRTNGFKNVSYKKAIEYWAKRIVNLNLNKKKINRNPRIKVKRSGKSFLKKRMTDFKQTNKQTRTLT